MKLLVIIRGIPGSGKSTLGKKIKDQGWNIGTEMYEADEFFTRADGSYNFQSEFLWQAHRYCYRKVQDAMHRKVEQIIVSNTATRKWEYEQYIDLARKHGYKIQVIDVHSEFDNVHNIPEEGLKHMNERWTPFDRQLLRTGRGS